MERAEHTDLGASEPEYESPKIVDYGSLLELTKSGHVTNSDVPAGTPNTAFSVH
jgi:hypothetical protein